MERENVKSDWWTLIIPYNKNAWSATWNLDKNQDARYEVYDAKHRLLIFELPDDSVDYFGCLGMKIFKSPSIKEWCFTYFIPNYFK